MIKAILIFVVAAALILYLGLRGKTADNVSQAIQAEQSPRQDRLSEPHVEARKAVETEGARNEPKKPSASEATTAQSKEEYTSGTEADGDVNTETDEEVEDETPSVKRSQLIGGADVEWIEPKPKEPGDKFGKPPM